VGLLHERKFEELHQQRQRAAQPVELTEETRPLVRGS
jgi:hypothetical protein